MEDDCGRSKRRSIKPKQFSPEPEPVRKPKQRQISRSSTGGQKKSKTQQNLNISAPQVDTITNTSIAQSDIVPEKPKVVLKLNLGSKPSATSTSGTSKKSNGTIPKSNQKKEEVSSSTKNGARLKLTFDSDGEYDIEPTVFTQKEKSIPKEVSVEKKSEEIELQCTTEINDQETTSEIEAEELKECVTETTSLNIEAIEQSTTSIKAEESPKIEQSPKQDSPVVQGRTVLVGKSLKPVLIATPNLAERRSAGGRSRKPPPSKEYNPESDKKPVIKKKVSLPKPQPPQQQKPVSVFSELFPDHLTPSATPVTSTFQKFPFFPQTPLHTPTPVVSSPPPDTTPFSSSGFSIDISRPARNKTKNISDFAPSLLPKKEQAKLKTPAILPQPKHTPQSQVQSAFKFPPPVSSSSSQPSVSIPITTPLSISKPSPIPRIQQQASVKLESSPEVESPIDQGDPEVVLFFGEAINFIKNINPNVNMWLEELEKTVFKGEFFRRAMFLDEKDFYITTKDDEIFNVDEDNEETLYDDFELSDVDDIDNETNNDDEIDIITTETSMFQSINVLHQIVEPYAERLTMLYPNKRMTFDDINNRISDLIKTSIPKPITRDEYKSGVKRSNEPYGAKLELARCMNSILNIIKDQYRMELVYSTRDKGIPAFYCYTLQNAERMKTLLFQNFSKTFVGAHEVLLCSLEFEPLCSYLNILRFLKASGTTSGTFFISHASPKFERGKNVISEILNLKVRDPYHRLFSPSTITRKLKEKNAYLLVVYPGVYDESIPHKPIYHAHESIFRQGLANIGAPIEKVIVRKRFDKPASMVDIAEWSISFLRDKFREVVLRRSKDRIFVASWGSTCLHVHEAALNIDGISGIIDFAMPLKSSLGYRGVIGDTINYTYCPTLLIVGEKSKLSTKREIETLRTNMIMPTGLLTIGKADDNLNLPASYMAKNYLTPMFVNKLIMEHVVDFMNLVMKCTKRDTHTKHLEIPDMSSIIVDMNAMILDDNNDDNIDFKLKRQKSPNKSREPKRRRTESIQSQIPQNFQILQQQQPIETIEDNIEYSPCTSNEQQYQTEEYNQNEKNYQLERKTQEEEKVETMVEYDEDLDREAQEAAAALESNFDEEEDYY